MSLKVYGDVTTEKTVTLESIKKGEIDGWRTTIIETGELDSLDLHKIGDELTEGTVTSCVINRPQQTHDQMTTVCEKYEDVAGDEWVIRIVGTGSEEPIETHPAFSKEANGYPIILAGTGDARENGAEFDGTEPNSKFEFFPPNAENDLGGVESYLVPSVVLEATKEFSDFNEVGWSQIYDVGKIKDVPINIEVGQVRNWLLVGTQYDYENGKWKVTNQYQLSGAKGWNENIYLLA